MPFSLLYLGKLDKDNEGHTQVREKTIALASLLLLSLVHTYIAEFVRELR